MNPHDLVSQTGCHTPERLVALIEHAEVKGINP